VEPLLALDGVSKRYGALTVVDGVSFAVAPGETLGVIGPNGAGKSTIFNLITGDAPADAGRITFEGASIGGLPPHARCQAGIGRTYQIPHPFAKMTVFENLLVGAAFGARQRERECYDHCVEVLRVTGLLSRANVSAGTLTLLQRKRLELARALAVRPRLLLLDEIAGGLTEHECQELLETIRSIHARGTAIVWVEHIVHTLVSFVSRLLVLNFGKKLDDGPPARVLANPVVREVYLGMPAS
jgi:branched-chain amino acid transport system ATP-binding protein